MNKIEITANITGVINYANAIGIHCQDNMFPGKISTYTTRITGSAMDKWKDKLAEGYIIVYQGNIAEARQSKQSAYKPYIVVYNPEIKDVYRLVPEHLGLPNEESKPEKQEQS